MAEALRNLFASKGQGHVFKFFDSLSAERQEAFIQQLSKIDLDEVLLVHKGFASAAADGHVAAVLMAGGQGTRLGSDLPKDVGLPSHRSLFEIQAQRIIRLQQVAHAAHPQGRCPIVPWYIMTSPLTEAKTKKFFHEKSFFGLGSNNVIFFNQEDMPAVTPDGKLMLEDIDRVSTAPNGNGAIFSAMNKTGCLTDMASRGVEHVFVYGVDNILIRIADPVFVGFAHEKHADCATKESDRKRGSADNQTMTYLWQAYPEEPVGVVCLKDGKPNVVEYSELPGSLATKKDEGGNLLFNAATIAMHMFSLQFLRDVVDKHLKQAHLTYHLAKKKIPTVNDKGEKFTPKEANGWKFELFVFDVFPFSRHLAALEVAREEEFSPLKNAEGNKSDSPNTCRTDVSNLHRKFIAAAGGQVNGDGLIEVSPLLTYAGEGLEKHVRGKMFTAPFELK